MGLSGLEPPTSRLSGGRSNRLSYKPIFRLAQFPKPKGSLDVSIHGGDKRDRTADPLLAKQVLSQLSYTPISSSRTLKIKQQRISVIPLTLDVRVSCFIHSGLHRKEVIQPHLPIRLPCYDFTPVANPTFGSALLVVELLTSGITGAHGVTGGVYKARERIHRGMLIRDY